MLWRTRTDPSHAAIMTGSATVDWGVVYTGVSSKTEHIRMTPTFRESVQALDARTGRTAVRDDGQRLFGPGGILCQPLASSPIGDGRRQPTPATRQASGNRT
jgi:hypothetical protein